MLKTLDRFMFRTKDIQPKKGINIFVDFWISYPVCMEGVDTTRSRGRSGYTSWLLSSGDGKKPVTGSKEK